jgi:hypothetical protein
MRKLWDDCGLAPTPLVLPSPLRDAELFMIDLESACRRLGSTRLRCSLFAIRPQGIPVRAALARLIARFETLGPVGALDDNQIGFLLLDRGHSSERDDDVVATAIQRQTAGALAPGSVKRFVALHYWADEISGTEDLVRRLEDRAFRRLAPLPPKAVAAGM